MARAPPRVYPPRALPWNSVGDDVEACLEILPIAVVVGCGRACARAPGGDGGVGERTAPPARGARAATPRERARGKRRRVSDESMRRVGDRSPPAPHQPHDTTSRLAPLVVSLRLRSPTRLMLSSDTRGVFVALALVASPLALLAQAAPIPFTDSPVPLPGLARTHDPHPTTTAITEEDLKTRLYIVADDSMEGREAGTRGGARANAYLVRELTRLGLTPAGDGGTFLQTIPLSVRAPDTTSTLRIDGVPVSCASSTIGCSSRASACRPFLADSRTAAPSRAPVCRRSSAVASVRAAARAGRRARSRRRLRRAARQQRATCHCILAARQSPRLPRRGRGARRGRHRRRRAGFFRLARDAYDDRTRPSLALTVLLGTRALGDSIFGRSLDSADCRARPADRSADRPASSTVPPRRRRTTSSASCRAAIPSCAISTSRSARTSIMSASGRPVDHDSIRAFNAGRAPARRRRSTAASGDRRSSGRGSARLLDSLHRARTARVSTRSTTAPTTTAAAPCSRSRSPSRSPARRAKPKRSLLFVWHTAEEKGLFGAQYFADHPTVPRDSIVAQINMDQMGRGEPEDDPRRRCRTRSSSSARGVSRPSSATSPNGERATASTVHASTISSTRTAIPRTRTAAAITTCTRATAFRSCSSAPPRGTSTTTW